MNNLYSERAESLDGHAKDMMEAFMQLYDSSHSTDAQLIATAVVYAGELIAAAMYRAMAKEG
jgi:hypothetical protein